MAPICDSSILEPRQEHSELVNTCNLSPLRVKDGVFTTNAGSFWGISSLPEPKAHREVWQVAAVCHDCVQVTSQVGTGGIMVLATFWESINAGSTS